MTKTCGSYENSSMFPIWGTICLLSHRKLLLSILDRSWTYDRYLTSFNRVFFSLKFLNFSRCLKLDFTILIGLSLLYESRFTVVFISSVKYFVVFRRFSHTVVSVLRFFCLRPGSFQSTIERTPSSFDRYSQPRSSQEHNQNREFSCQDFPASRMESCLSDIL